jgi:hypothetical protein
MGKSPFAVAPSKDSSHPLRQDRFRTNCAEGQPCGQQEAVLIDIVKLVELPERSIPTLIRVVALDFLERLVPRSLYFSLESGFVLFGSRVVGDRETNLTFFSVGEKQAAFSAPNFYKLPDEMIQSGAQVLDYVADEGNAITRETRISST